MALEPGLHATFRYTVAAADTAAAVGSGEVPVLATPRVLALAEQATVAAVAGEIEAGATTVGTRVELEHLAPSVVGAEVSDLRSGYRNSMSRTRQRWLRPPNCQS
jgi:predicted thioesterase